MHGTAYLVMEYCDGKPLDKFVDDGNGVSPRILFEIYTSLINALEHVHQHGIIHGDMKPSNVLVRTSGRPVLLDFGSARQEMLRMAVGQVSDGYSPPEFYGTSEKIGPWSDIYGLGATFYKLITGIKLPVATDRSKSDNYTPISNSLPYGYSVKFLEVIDNSLSLSPLERPQSISALKRLLPDSGNFSDRHKLIKDLRGEVPKVAYPTNSLTLNWKAIAIVFGIVVLFSGCFAFLNRPSEEPLVVEVTKVSPIVIEDQTVLAETPVVTPKNVAPSSTGNLKLQQALTYLASVSTSSEISSYSIPQTELAVRSFKFVVSEIDKKFDSAFDRKTYSYSESSKEYLFKDFSLSDIKSLGFTATDAKCSNGSTGPLAVSCRKSGLDFKCRFIELSVKYEHVCLSTFSLQ
jgi:serine/threonine protein kinase